MTESGIFDFGTIAPEIGTVLKLDEQEYELRSTTDYVRRDGTPSKLLVWESACPKCGTAFTATTGLKTKSVNRRCPDCAAPFKPVKGKRSRRVTVEVIEP